MPRIALTDRFVSGAKPIGARTDYFDESVPGLALRVSDTGRKVWTFHFTSPRDGKRARHNLGTYPATSLAKARGLAIETRQQVEDGNDPRRAGQAGAAELTFSDLVDIYFADPDKAKLRSLSEIRRRLKADALPAIGAVKLAKLARRDMRDVMERIAKRGAARQAFLTFKDIQAVLRWGVRHEYLDRNPIEGMEKPSGSTPKERVLSNDEIRTLWNGLPSALAGSKNCQRIIKLLLLTGQRSGEVSGMARSELDLHARTWTIPGRRSKNGHAHLVPLSDDAVELIREALADIPKDCEYLFPGENGAAVNSHVLGRSITRARKQSKERPLGRFGIAPWSAHDLRRTALTGMAKLGVAPHVIAHVANHRSISKSGVTFAHYVMHSYEAEKRHALELWADRLSAIIEGDAAKVVNINAAR